MDIMIWLVLVQVLVWVLVQYRLMDTMIGVDHQTSPHQQHPLGLHGARFSAEIYTRGCHWIPRMKRTRV
jgi:hypothetical protein